MNASLFDRARAERFAQLLDEAGGARRHHSRSRLDRELTEPVEIGRKLHAMRFDISPDADFKGQLRARLIATAQREGIGATATPDRRTLRKRIMSTRPRARGAIVVGIAAGTLALSGVSVASGEAMPGDTLYGMKRSTERAQLALAGSDVSRGQLYLDFARTRLHEAFQVRSSEVSFVGSLHDMDSETLHGSRTLITSAVVQHDTTALEAIDKFVAQQRMLVAQMLNLSGQAGRGKVTESLALLSRIEERSRMTRAALACGTPTSGDDALGPIPVTCAGKVRGQQAPAVGGQRPAQQPQAGTAPEGTVAAGQTPVASLSAAAPAPEPEGGLLDELGRILSRLLG